MTDGASADLVTLVGLETKADNRRPAGGIEIWHKIEEIMRDVADDCFGKHSRAGS